MFRGDIKLKRVSTGLAGWNNMSHATSLSGMFAGCKALAEIFGLDNWDVSYITDLSLIHIERCIRGRVRMA